MDSKQNLQKTLNHTTPNRLVVDFGATSVTGIHCKIVGELRDYYELEKRPVKVIEPFQMLGEIDSELQEIIGVDCLPLMGPNNMLGTTQTEFHLQTTPWGQEVFISRGIDLSPAPDGAVYVYVEGDRSFRPATVMPSGCYFFNAIEREQPFDEEALNPEDNLEEFGSMTESDLEFFEREATRLAATGKGVVAGFGGTALGDIAFVPGMGLKQPKGIRSVANWYMYTALRPDYVQAIFERQTDIAIDNYRKLWQRIGSKVDVVFTCGTDFGTQDSQFCSVRTFHELWLPYYQRMNRWIHENTTWKVFKHSCGAIVPLLPSLVDAGFDILNPVQINARDMDSNRLKKEFGHQFTFWGGGIDTQRILPSASPAEVRSHVLHQCERLGKNGGFVFNAVHNIQANAPIENVVAMINALKELRK